MSTSLKRKKSATSLAATKSKPSEAGKPQKSAGPALGAPSQHKQSSRKGKRAWRKNVDLGDVEEGLEGLRAEERVTGSTLQKKTDQELFQIDVKGDERVRKALPRFSKSLLSSTKILNQRSAVPAVFSRGADSSIIKKRKLTHEDKERLLRIGRRMRKGPLNTVMDPTDFGKGSAILDVTEAVKSSGTYDVWEANDSEEEEVKDGLEHLKKRKAKPANAPHPHSLIKVPAVAEPHQGASYNPPVSAHQELLRTAHEIEERRVKEAEKLKAWSEKMEKARKVAAEEAERVGVAPGMTVGIVEEDGVEAEAEEVIVKKAPERKTKQQRNKAAKLRAEKRLLAEKIARKRLLASITTVKALRSKVDQSLNERKRTQSQRELALQERLTKGLAGQRLGRHKVQEGDIDVQLGEELSESLRTLKPEGNLFRDRFLSMQNRALIEPRVPVLPRKRATKDKVYEKHAWKRFE
ncbi:hypothetical protein JAAARDRAFT_131965 [Jaapia argillacea MUCL 33604]|uniref:Ribosome biogenesis protein NOP53 n=1 Tax=Jaapia argillacea MUCL 33604 TaxID=933084 RepID=A0A067PP40_9AGAM|nr:hypothetical protein JAAARDRAFT_131965 [Jaapia argillacea MUCL 33604]